MMVPTQLRHIRRVQPPDCTSASGSFVMLSYGQAATRAGQLYADAFVQLSPEGRRRFVAMSNDWMQSLSHPLPQQWSDDSDRTRILDAVGLMHQHMIESLHQHAPDVRLQLNPSTMQFSFDE